MTVVVQVWSTGSTRYNTIPSSYFRGANIVFCLFSAMHPESSNVSNHSFEKSLGVALQGKVHNTMPFIMCGVNYSDDIKAKPWSQQDKENATETCKEKELEILFLDWNRECDADQMMRRIVKQLLTDKQIDAYKKEAYTTEPAALQKKSCSDVDYKHECKNPQSLSTAVGDSVCSFVLQLCFSLSSTQPLKINKAIVGTKVTRMLLRAHRLLFHFDMES